MWRGNDGSDVTVEVSDKFALRVCSFLCGLKDPKGLMSVIIYVFYVCTRERCIFGYHHIYPTCDVIVFAGLVK